VQRLQGDPLSRRSRIMMTAAFGKGVKTQRPQPQFGRHMPSGLGGTGSAGGTLVPTPLEVLTAVTGLYEDELRPVGRILRKRTSEIIAARITGRMTLAVGEEILQEYAVDPDQLRRICESCEALNVIPEKGGDWCALLIGWPPRFVDIYSRYDRYPPALWTAFAAYCESPAAHGLALPGGRYTCARALMARDLPFLAGLSLGCICHIVQLALTEKKILGYFSQSVVPYARSQSMRKEHCAKTQQPCSRAALTAPMTLATWDAARACLREMIASATGGEVPLSNVKRLFRSRFHLELSETSFGYSKVSEFLQDANFSDICTVHLRGRGYIVTRPMAGSIAPVVPPGNLKAGGQASLAADSLEPDQAASKVISLVTAVPLPPPSAPKPSASDAYLPRLLGQTRGASNGDVTAGELWKRRPDFCSSSMPLMKVKPPVISCSPPSSPARGLPTPLPSWRNRARQCVEKRTFLELPETPNPHQALAHRRTFSAPPRCLGSSSSDNEGTEDGEKEECFGAPDHMESGGCSTAAAEVKAMPTFEEVAAKLPSTPSQEKPRKLPRARFSTCSNLADVEASLVPSTTPTTPGSLSTRSDSQKRLGASESQPRRQRRLLTPSLLTPGKLKTKGVLVQNTFLHFVKPPLTPARPGARSSSVPPSAGAAGMEM